MRFVKDTKALFRAVEKEIFANIGGIGVAI